MEISIRSLLDGLEDSSVPIEEKNVVSAMRIKELTKMKLNGNETKPGRGLKRRALTLALAAVLVLALSVTAYAAWNVHAARQQALKEDLQIEEHHADSYVEYDTADAQEGLVLLSAVNDGESQRVYVNVSPVEKDVISRFPETIAFAWKLDGMTLNGEDYWMTAGPKLKAGRSVSGHDAIYEAVLEDAYDESTKTLTLECFISNNAIAQAQAYENGEYVHLTITLWDHQAQADAEVGLSAEWLEKQKSFGSVWFAPTESEMRRFDFGNRLYHDTETDKTIEMVSLELTPFSAVWGVSYEVADAVHTPGGDIEAYRPWSLLEDKVCIEAKLVFSDGSEFSTGGALTCPYENGVVNLHCGWGAAIDIDDVQRIVLGDLVLWEAD
ncbi:MAG: hypothetical protein J6P58_04500 [Oscillospiraceae bacterium]|nr:hypothetical protein [Oscillospiraceae bacterium]